MDESRLSAEQKRIYDEFYDKQRIEFDRKMREQELAEKDAAELEFQREVGFKDPKQDSRRGGILDKMASRIAALEAENADLTDIVRRFNYLVSYLSQSDPELLQRVVVSFGFDSKQRNFFMHCRELVPPDLAEIIRLRREASDAGTLAICREWGEEATKNKSDETACSKEEPISGTWDGSGCDSNITQEDDFPDFDAEYGWLSPTGKFFKVAFGEHSLWAENKAVELGYAQEDDFHVGADEDVLAKLHYGDEVLITNGWCLIHDPLHGPPRHHVRTEGLTKKQKEYLFDMYVHVGKEDSACALYRDEL